MRRQSSESSIHLFYTGYVGRRICTHFFAYGEEERLRSGTHFLAFSHFSPFSTRVFFFLQVFKRRHGSRFWMQETDWTSSSVSPRSPALAFGGVDEKRGTGDERDWAVTSCQISLSLSLWSSSSSFCRVEVGPRQQTLMKTHQRLLMRSENARYCTSNFIHPK